MGVTLRGWPASPTAKDKYILVESEAEARTAQGLLKNQILLWPSTDGALSFLEVEELMKLNGSDVLLWPANTHGARQAMVLVANSLSRGTDRLRMIYVNGDDPMGFNATDVAGWDAAKLVEWAKTRARPYERQEAPDPVAELMAMDEDLNPPPPPAKISRGTPRTKKDGSNPKGVQLEQEAAFVSWESMGLDRIGHGPPLPHLANAQKILANHPSMAGRLWYDDFHDRVFSTLFGEQPEEWADHHDTRLTIWMQSELKIGKMGIQTVQRAVDEFARMHTRNEPRDWMESLTWDATPRLATFLSDAFGASQNDYTAAVGRCWMISMVARIYQPGAKVDYMPVFEGWQGMSKSSALDALGGKWFAETHEDITKKDFLQNLRGKMLIEFSELHAFKRAEIERIKGVITCRNDRYRDSYGRRSTDKPRQCVFAGTTNRDDWVQDDTGARRFWPVACTEVSVNYIRDQREQLFAEAVAEYRKGTPWWDVDVTLARSEQDARRDLDVWTDYVMAFASIRPWVVVAEILSGPLDIEPARQGKSDQMRVASILRVAGWKRGDKWVAGETKKVWINPAGGNGGNEQLAF